MSTTALNDFHLAILKSIKEGEAVTSMEIQHDVPDCSPGAVGHLAKGGYVEICGSKGTRHLYRLTDKGVHALEGGPKPGVVPHNLLGAPVGKYVASAMGSDRPGAMDAFKLPSRRADGLRVPDGTRINLCGKEGR